MAFLEDSYMIPTKPYMRLEKGENKFRVVSSAITGYEYWIDEASDDGVKKRKPVRVRTFEEVPRAFQEESKHFWAFCVWNYKTERTEILEITQKGIMTSLRGLTKNKKWGDPFNYDIVIFKEGEGFGTEYSTTPEPPTKLEFKDKVNKNIDLEMLFSGGDPFNPTEDYSDVVLDDV